MAAVHRLALTLSCPAILCFLCVSSGTYHILIQTAVVGMMMMECYPSCLQHQKYWGQRSMTSPVICGPWGSSCTSCKYSNCHMYILQVQQLSGVLVGMRVRPVCRPVMTWEISMAPPFLKHKALHDKQCITKSTHTGVNKCSAGITQTQQARTESPAVALTRHASKYKVHKLCQRYILSV